MPAPASVAPVLVASKRSAADLRARSSSEATVIPIDARYCFFLRLSHKAVSEAPRLARADACQPIHAPLPRHERHARGRRGGRFRTPPLETVWRARRGFVRQPRLEAIVRCRIAAVSFVAQRRSTQLSNPGWLGACCSISRRCGCSALRSANHLGEATVGRVEDEQSRLARSSVAESVQRSDWRCHNCVWSKPGDVVAAEKLDLAVEYIHRVDVIVGVLRHPRRVVSNSSSWIDSCGRSALIVTVRFSRSNRSPSPGLLMIGRTRSSPHRDSVGRG